MDKKIACLYLKSVSSRVMIKAFKTTVYETNKTESYIYEENGNGGKNP